MHREGVFLYWNRSKGNTKIYKEYDQCIASKALLAYNSQKNSNALSYHPRNWDDTPSW